MAHVRGSFAQLLAPGLRQVFGRHYSWIVMDDLSKAPQILHCCRECGDVFTKRPKYNRCTNCNNKCVSIRFN